MILGGIIVAGLLLVAAACEGFNDNPFVTIVGCVFIAFPCFILATVIAKAFGIDITY